MLGTTETMNAADRAKLKGFNQQYYTPENMVLVVVGPVDPKAIRSMVDATFGKRPRTGYAPPPTPPPPQNASRAPAHTCPGHR